MKKTILLIVVALMSLGVHAESEKYGYCIMQCFGKVFSTKYAVTLDFGTVASKRHQIYEGGKKKKFVSNGESLNYMGKRGWEVVDTYTDRDFKQQLIIYFILKKKIENDEDIYAGLELGDSEDDDD